MRDQGVNHGRIGECRGITQVSQFAHRDLAYDAAHDLARASLWKGLGPLNMIRRGDRANFLSHLGDQLSTKCLRCGNTLLRHDIGIDPLAFDLVGKPDDRGFGHVRMLRQRALQFGRPQTMAGHVQHIIDPTRDPVIPIGIAPGAVLRIVEAGESAEVGLEISLMASMDRARQRSRSERRGEAYIEPYVEPLSDARTKLADF